MDPFIAITFGKDVYRTKVVRHDLNPVWGDRFILYAKRNVGANSISSTLSSGTLGSASDSPTTSMTSTASSTAATSENPGAAMTTIVHFSLLDWEKVTRDEHIGDAVLDITEIMKDAPNPDPETGLYSEEAMRLHPFTDLKLPISIRDGKDKEKWEGQFSPAILVR